MMTCPFCKKQIGEVYVTATTLQKATLDDQGEIEEYGEFEDRDETYNCVECDAVLNLGDLEPA